jgi:hypothetical protein
MLILGENLCMIRKNFYISPQSDMNSSGLEDRSS